jgi:hypothetical protein
MVTVLVSSAGTLGVVYVQLHVPARVPLWVTVPTDA